MSILTATKVFTFISFMGFNQMLANFFSRLPELLLIGYLNRRYAILIGLVVAFIFALLPSLPDSIAKSSDEGKMIENTKGRVVKYANDVYKVQPENFAVSRSISEIAATSENIPNNKPKLSAKKEAQILREKEYDKRRVEKGLPPLTDAEKNELEINRQNAAKTKTIVPGAGLGTDDFTDSLVNKGLNPDAPQTMPLPSLTFDGATSADNVAIGNGLFTPPDVNGDVGTNHYVSSVNLALKIFNKSGSVAAGPIKTQSLWASLPLNDPCRTRNDGDPVVVYDSLADRWFITQFAIPGFRNGFGSNYQCIAVSTSSDPTGSYYLWSYIYPQQLINDYPKVGVWTDAYHITFNQFDTPTLSFKGLGILSQDRAKALVGNPSASVVYKNIGDIDPIAGGALPADIDGIVAPPVGMAEVIGEYRANEFGDPFDAIRYYKWVPNFSTPANSTLTILPDVQMAEFDARNPTTRDDIEVLGGGLLDSLSNPLMYRFAYRNLGTSSSPVNSFTGSFTVNVSGVNPTAAASYQAGIRWFEMRRTNDSFSIFDQGTHNLTAGNGATGLNNWMGSIAQDHQGNIGLGFSQAGVSQNADIKIAGRTNNVANSGVLNEGEALFFDALGSQDVQGGPRWGDYSSMNVDPIDDCTFWYTQEYYAATSDQGWSTRVGKFKYPSCTPAPKATITGTITSCSTGLPFNNASVNATGGFNRVSIANGTYSMTVAPGTYTVAANKSSGFVGIPQNITVADGATANVNICLNGFPEVASNINPAIVAESCGVSNGSPEPGELITVSLPISNIGGANTNNLTVTLQPTGGVINPSAAQTYGTVAASGSVVSRNFTFQVNPATACGNTITLTWNLQDGANNLGTVTKIYTTGTVDVYLNENFDTVNVPLLPSGWTQTQVFGNQANWVTNRGFTSSVPTRLFINEPAANVLTAIETPSFFVRRPDTTLSFTKVYGISEFNGVVLDIKIGNGNWQDIITAGGTFITGEYISQLLLQYQNPLGTRRVWNNGLPILIEPTVIKLPPTATGQNVKLRWVLGTAGGPSSTGDFSIDDVKVASNVVCNTNCSALTSRPRSDFDGDGKTDLSVFRPNEGNWYLNRSTAGFASLNFGIATDTISPGDFDGDGKADLSVFRPTAVAGAVDFYVLRSSNNTITGAEWGIIGDIPVVSDYDGDGKDDYAIWRGSTGDFWIVQSQSGTARQVNFGIATDKPVSADYNGDNKTDFAVFRPSIGTWFIADNVNGTVTTTQFGLSSDIPVFADYDGDGKDDIAVFRPNNGVWYVLKSSGGVIITQFGLSGDVPVPGDYDGDGKYDQAVYRAGIWYVNSSMSGVTISSFGLFSDKPIPRGYLPN
jgi:hypothetical protein